MSKKRTNRLANEKSPYLLQHATNPVDWYPWSNEALDKAKYLNKLIFLSIGYSTCHWCHVMEKECFEDEKIARLLNSHYISIKIDREERPDVDRVYMTFVQATTGTGGWPMSVWLTPDLEPIMGGTYFPPDDRYQGQPGFYTILLALSSKWTDNPDEIKHQAKNLVQAVSKNMELKTPRLVKNSNEEFVKHCYEKLSFTHDRQFGGFGKAPKFPQPVNFNFLLRAYCQDRKNKRKGVDMTLHTLRMMANGGVYDHIGKGFHRYSTDRKWMVPHFEKMLYDQAQLACTFIEAHSISKDSFFADVAKEILEYVDRDLSDQNGGFYSAEDADSLPSYKDKDKKEGAFYVWGQKEIEEHLVGTLESAPKVKLSELFCHHYGVKKDGNVDPYQDPHDELKHKNVLIVWERVEETANFFNVSASEVSGALADCRKQLFWKRHNRPRPHLDDKYVTSWNGLMISAYAKAFKEFGDEAYKTRTLQGLQFVKSHLYDPTTKRLYRSIYRNRESDTITQLENPIPGKLEDYSNMVKACLDAYEAVWENWLLSWAYDLQNSQDNQFWDVANHGYFTSDPADEKIILKLKEEQDGAEPSASSISVSNLVRLSLILNKPSFHEQAKSLVNLYHSKLDSVPFGIPEMVVGTMWLQVPPIQFIVVGESSNQTTQNFLKAINAHFIPFKVIILADKDEANIVYKYFEMVQSLRAKVTESAVYICQDFTCKPPITTVGQLEKYLTNLTS